MIGNKDVGTRTIITPTATVVAAIGGTVITVSPSPCLSASFGQHLDNVSKVAQGWMLFH